MSPVRPEMTAARCVAILAVLLAVAPSSSASAAVVIGLSDQRPEHLTAPVIGGLELPVARLVVPWDAALSQPELVDRWLRAAALRQMRPLVSFERRTTDRCPDAPCKAPSVGEYADAVEAFRLRWPQVTEFTAWNEPNHPGQPTAELPERAADYHRALAEQCGRCTVAAGDFVDSASMRSYFGRYRSQLGAEPQAWALHDYGDLIYDRASYLDWLLERTAAPVWLTETGGIVFLRSSLDGTVQLPLDEARGARALERLAALLPTRTRIERAYVYHLQQDPQADFDAALLRADGSPRPAFAVFSALAGSRRPPATPNPDPGGTASPAAGTTAAGGPLSAAAPGSSALASSALAETDRRTSAPRIASIRSVDGGWRVALRCAKRQPRGCAGRISLTVASRRSGRAVTVAESTFRLRDDRWRHLHLADRRARRASRPITTHLLVRGEAFVSRTWPLEELR